MTSPATPGAVQCGPALAGQTVVVIGGSSGIGLETARRARAEGAEVIITGRNPDRLRQAALEVGAQRAAAFDATDAAALQRFFQDLPASSTPRCRHRCSGTSLRNAAMNCGRRSRSAASSGPPTSPPSPSTS
jgi:NAD(P)-dependent dehydrogenase (short-subunit alcohol dehydrogenase family)